MIANYQDVLALNSLGNIGTKPLVVATTVFPFRLFPCVITLDREKITISNYIFFFTREIDTIMISDIASITINENLLFANVSLVSSLNLNRKISSSYFWKEDLRRLGNICEGLRIALREKIDVMKLSNNQLSPQLEEIGGR